jgi:aconitate hydratase
MFRAEYEHIFRGDAMWNAIDSSGGQLFEWRGDSTYVREPPYFLGMAAEPPGFAPVIGGRCLVRLGHSITTDHISPAGAIAANSPAGAYLQAQGVEPIAFNSYGSRRGNHEVMVRGTFANVRLRNLLVPGTDGPWTVHFPSGERMWIYDAAMKYAAEGTPLLVIAGREYGSGSSRDWAAKGPSLLGVRAVIAESYERIHRSNLIGMGILPLEFAAGESAESLDLSGDETYDLQVAGDLTPGATVSVRCTRPDGTVTEFRVRARLDSPVEVRYLVNGGILQTVLRDLMRTA